MALKHIKLKIYSIRKTATVTRAMEAVSAVKMRKSQERAFSGRAYAAAGLSILERLAGSTDAGSHPMMNERIGKTCVVLVTSDKGLAGSLNSGVIRKAEQYITSHALAKSDVRIIAIGRRGGDYFASRSYELAMKQTNVGDGVSEEELRSITDKVSTWHEAGEIGSCIVVYQNFLSTFEQKPEVRQIIPITKDAIREIVTGIRPAKGRYSPPQKHREHEASPAAYTIEPDTESVLSALLPRLINLAVFHALLEAKASEHSARMVAMKSATDKAKEMAQDLTRTFNKVRQAAITREVSEITSGIEAMK